jgi:hypothetical protein
MRRGLQDLFQFSCHINIHLLVNRAVVYPMYNLSRPTSVAEYYVTAPDAEETIWMKLIAAITLRGSAGRIFCDIPLLVFFGEPVVRDIYSIRQVVTSGSLYNKDRW